MEAGDAADEKIKASEHAAKNHKMLHAATLKKLQAKDEELAEMKKKWDEAERQVSRRHLGGRVPRGVRGGGGACRLDAGAAGRA